MRLQRRWLFVCASAIHLFAGCKTPFALRNQTVHQGNTVADIHEQQVLDNLAKFVCDPYAIPSFAVATSGSTIVGDQYNSGFSLNFMRTGFDSAGLTLGGQRDQTLSWVTTPVTDPRKLELMRCAYQRVLTRCGCFSGESTSCPNCVKRFNKFYTGKEYDTDVTKDGKTCYKCENGEVSNLVSAPVDDPCICSDCQCKGDEASCDPACDHCPSPGNGIVNSECLSCSGCRWFCWTRDKGRVPECCSHVGHYCGVYVWVPCGPGRDELAKLTLVILDFAVHDAAVLPTKDIEAYLDCNLQPTTQEKAFYTVKTTVALEDSTNTVHSGDHIVKECSTQPEELPQGGDKAAPHSVGASSRTLVPIPAARPLGHPRTPTPGAGILLEEQYLRTVR